MTTTLRREIIWLITILTLTILFFGRLTHFKFGDFNISLHDTYFSMPTNFSIVFTFLFLSLLIMGSREIKYKYSRMLPTTILLIINSLTLLLTGFTLYALVGLSIFGGLIEAYANGKKTGNYESALFDMTIYIELAGLITLALLTIYEVFLIIRLVRLRKMKNRS